MRRSTIAATVALAICAPLMWRAHVHADVPSVLRVWPGQIHNGSTIYISGSGFRPGTHTSLTVACPDWVHAAGRLHNWDFRDGPVTNASGDFAGWPIADFTIHGVPDSPCTIYASYVLPDVQATQQFVSNFPAIYEIVPAGQKLRPCDSHVCATVTPNPKRVKAGYRENLTIRGGWGGAMADVRVSYPHSTQTVHTRAHLNYKGEASVPIKVDGRVDPSEAQVQIDFKLGTYTGHSSGRFTVTR